MLNSLSTIFTVLILISTTAWSQQSTIGLSMGTGYGYGLEYANAASEETHNYFGEMQTPKVLSVNLEFGRIHSNHRSTGGTFSFNQFSLGYRQITTLKSDTLGGSYVGEFSLVRRDYKLISSEAHVFLINWRPKYTIGLHHNRRNHSSFVVFTGMNFQWRSRLNYRMQRFNNNQEEFRTQPENQEVVGFGFSIEPGYQFEWDAGKGQLFMRLSAYAGGSHLIWVNLSDRGWGHAHEIRFTTGYTF